MFMKKQVEAANWEYIPSGYMFYTKDGQVWNAVFDAYSWSWRVWEIQASHKETIYSSFTY